MKTIDSEKLAKIRCSLSADYVDRGLVKFNDGDLSGCIDETTKALELDPENVLAFVYRGIAYAELEDYTASITNFDQAIEINSDFTDAYYHRGLAHLRLLDFEAAQHAGAQRGVGARIGRAGVDPHPHELRLARGDADPVMVRG